MDAANVPAAAGFAARHVDESSASEASHWRGSAGRWTTHVGRSAPTTRAAGAGAVTTAAAGASELPISPRFVVVCVCRHNNAAMEAAAAADDGAPARIVWADFPWQYGLDGLKGCIANKKDALYTTMSAAELIVLARAIPIARDGYILMWVTMPQWPTCMAVLRATGARYCGVEMVWLKLQPSGVGTTNGVGGFTASNVEVCVLGAMPDAPLIRASGTRLDAVKPTGHSVKPAASRELVVEFARRHGLGVPLEMFARCTDDRRFRYWLGDQIDAYRGMDAASVGSLSRSVRVPLPPRPPPRDAGAELTRRASERGAQSAAERALWLSTSCFAAPSAAAAAAGQKRDVVLNQELEYAVVLVVGPPGGPPPSGAALARLDVAAGLEPDGLLVVEADCSTLNDAVAAVDTAPGFGYRTLGFFAFDRADPSAAAFYIVAMREGGRLTSLQRRLLKQTIDVSVAPGSRPAFATSARTERVLAAIDSATRGARAAVLEFAPGGSPDYTVAEVGGLGSAEARDLEERVDVARRVRLARAAAAVPDVAAAPPAGGAAPP